MFPHAHPILKGRKPAQEDDVLEDANEIQKNLSGYSWIKGHVQSV